MKFDRQSRIELTAKLVVIVILALVGYGAFGIILPALLEISDANAAKGWQAKFTGTIVDVDPLANNGSSGLFFEIREDSGDSWVWIWGKDKLEGGWPSRGDTGTFYTKKVDGDDKYKWVEAKKPVVKKPSVRKSASVKTIPTSISWKSIVVGVPPADHTVLVRYKNGKTITTAYLNTKEQWKLETDRERVSGGREIATIKEWKEIPR